MTKILSFLQVLSTMYIYGIAGGSDGNKLSILGITVRLAVAIIVILVAQAIKKSAVSANTSGQAQNEG